MQRMHELMVSGNPGMGRMHELMVSGNPGMGRMHELMVSGNPGMGGGHDGTMVALGVAPLDRFRLPVPPADRRPHAAPANW